jgi:2-polyprenyl-3-methyl-5-hydroxy-6-metoxy-1,4-benzoquinol methylase
MVNSKELYNKFAPYFQLYSRKKSAYLRSVNKLILENLPNNKANILDVGCGDGVRGKYLFDKIKGERLLMIDNSSEMITLAKKYKNLRIKVKLCDISGSGLISDRGRFDVILCLWNVLGHIPHSRKRLSALRNIQSLLAQRGRLFLDISNRYNVRHYGFKKVAGNLIKDVIKPTSKNGDFSYQITINPKIVLDSTCHFFTPFETRRLLKKSGLKIIKEIPVDYSIGKIRRTIFEGHLFYILEK